MRISNNLMAMNANRMLGITNKKNKESVMKLSSGYRINYAADDAAGLAISEKMRRLIRGLNQGTRNAEDGVSWTQIGDGALTEAHDILHRMTELTVHALNGTNTDDDRMALELEFEQLQSELDRIGKTTQFNEIPIFEEHEIPYYQCEGSAQWDPQQMHVVTAGENDLTFEYRVGENDAPKTVTVTVPQGEYTTQELVDEIESALSALNMEPEQLVLELTQYGYCNANVENGAAIDKVSGGLSYLVYDMYKGGSFGALIGTTKFPDEYAPLDVVTGQNDSMTFDIEGFDGSSQTKSITLPPGSYTRSELIDLLNNQLADTSVKATAYGSGIKLSSDDAIVTGFKGNMFKIDGSPVYNSVFYDNVKYGNVVQAPAVFTGGYVLPNNSKDVEHQCYVIDGVNKGNNQLTLQPNGAATPVTITIPDEKYTAAQMAAKLNELFAAKGLELKAERITSGGFDGLKITSQVEGLDSQVHMDSSSSAYDTLFITREYNQYGNAVNPVNETKDDKEAVFNGTRDLTSLATTPLDIVAGVNDSFKVNIDGADYAIALTAKTYSSAQAVVDEINEQLNGSSALAGYKGKVKASLSTTNTVLLESIAGQGVVNLSAEENGTNKGFDVIFQGYRSSTTKPTASGTGSVTLNTPFDGNIGADESNMTIKVDGINYPVTLPTGNVNQDDIKNAIETAIPPRTEYINNEFATVTENGSNGDRNFTEEATGTEKTTSWSGNESGYSVQKEGEAGYSVSEPAVLEIGPQLKDSMVVNSSNNTIGLTLNGVTKTITLDHNTYTPASLKNHLQQKIDDAFGTGMGGAIVSLSGTTLTLTSRLPQGQDGSKTNIKCSTANSSFLKELNTTRGPAEWKSDIPLATNITIGADNQAFTFTYKENGNVQNITLNLTQGPYTRTSIVNEINAQLAKTGTGITAGQDGGRLTLTSGAVGDDVSISYKTAAGGSSAEALFGPLMTPAPAEILVNLKTEDNINIVAGVSDTFTIKVNGSDKTVTLDAGPYNRTAFVAMLNQKFTAAGIGVEAFESEGKLSYRTIDKGASASVGMSYSGGGNSMKAIYGTSPKTYSGVTVSFDSNGYMTLSTTNGGSSISVPATSGGAFQQAEITYTKINTESTAGYHSAKNSYIDGVSLSGDVTIDEWNNNLNFTFTDNGTNKSVSIEVPQATYTLPDLETKLQELVDASVGADKITVTVDANGVRMEAVNVGSGNRFDNFSGDFYYKVICSCTEKSVPQSATDRDGTQTVDAAFTVGRKNVKDNTSVIRQGISDELSLDLTYGNTTHTIKVTLDAGEYTADALKAHLQDKINEQLAAMGLEENLIEVGVGDVKTNVVGANDDKALNFKLSKSVQSPGEGQFIIDGVSGNAAFEIFYQTDGEMIPAYIRGNKDVTEGVTMEPGANDLSFKVDGVPYSITIPEGDYTAEELLTAVNDALNTSGAPVIAELDDGRLKLSHKKMGEHEITDVSGGAKKEIFFAENGELESPDPRNIVLSSEKDDKIALNRHVFNTVSLGINSCCISRPKYAEKALERLKEANRRISDIRSDFGSTQNRIEHAINNNQNKEENLQSAESVIRDTDMAKEIMAQANHNILLQAGQAMMAQANQSQNGVLTLLRQ